MATLLDQELLEYLTHLEDETIKRISAAEPESLPRLMHNQMKEILSAEKAFLAYINSNGTHPALSISLHGLPSIQSLNPDLEKMCELGQEIPMFSEIAKKMKKGMQGKNSGPEQHIYIPVTQEEWKTERARNNNEKLQIQIGFAVRETDNGKFELAVREDTYLQGYDQHSQEFPILIREGRMVYQVIWNRLIDDHEESYFVPNTAAVVKKGAPPSVVKKFDDITRLYKFGSSDYKGVEKPWFMRWRANAINYAPFLAAGTIARVQATQNILEAIERALQRKVAIKGLGKKDLEQELTFANIPFQNGSRMTPIQEELYTQDNHWNLIDKYNTKHEIVFSAGGESMGTISYILPHNKKYSGSYGGCYYRFTKGGISITIQGMAIRSDEEYRKLQHELQNVSWR